MTFPTDWARRCALTINASQIVGSGTHNGFPVLLTEANLPTDMLDRDGTYPARQGGGEIRFSADEAGDTKLPCHVVEFVSADNPANAKAIIYVGLNLPTASDTTIYVWYRTSTAIDQPKYNDNTDADGFQGSDYVWSNYDIVLPLGGFGGMRNLKQANASKNLIRYTPYMGSKAHSVASRTTGNKYISFGSVTRVGDRLYVVAREATVHTVSVTGGVGVWVSDDLGRTWSEDTGLAVTDASFDLRDPRLYLGADDTLWLFYSKTNAADTSRVVTYRTSSAPYTSWSAETALTSMTRANNGSRPIRLASGRIVVPCYDVPPGGVGGGICWPFVRWSDDGGATWTTDYLTADGIAPAVYDNYNETAIVESPTTPGTLIAITRRDTYLTLYRAVSTDSGETWSSFTSQAALAIDSGGVPDMPALLKTRDGEILLAHAKDRDSPEFRVLRSTDDGATWDSNIANIWANSVDTSVKPGASAGGQGGYCSMVEINKGLFALTYYYEDSATSSAKMWCTHFSKVENGALNAWTDTNYGVPTQVGGGIEFFASTDTVGNASLSFFNAVHNGGAFTISGWAKFDSTSDKAFAFVGSSVSPGDRGFVFAYDNRIAYSSADALRLYKTDGAATAIDNKSSAISPGTTKHRFGVFNDAGGIPTFIKDATTYTGTNAITGTAGDAELATRIGTASNGAADISTFRLDGWMGMWSFASSNLGADFEKTRYNAELTPASFVTAGTPTDTVTVPSPPTIGTATAGDASASVAFSAPANDGGATITGYTATSTPGSLSASGASSPITVTGLTNGVAYTFTVHATNSQGNSLESDASNSVTPTGGSEPEPTPVLTLGVLPLRHMLRGVT